MVVGSVPPVDWMGGGFLTEQKINSSKRRGGGDHREYRVLSKLGFSLAKFVVISR